MLLQARELSGHSKALTVVDFGSGSGNMVLILATVRNASSLPAHSLRISDAPLQLFPAISFIAVDMNGESLRLLQQRATATRLTNVSCVCGLIEHYSGPVDVAFALHACGSATDLALLQAQRARAIFVVSPCCIGKLKYSIAKAEAASSCSSTGAVEPHAPVGLDHIGAGTGCKECVGVAQPVHPRSSFMRGRMGGSEFALLVQFADFADGTCDSDCGRGLGVDVQGEGEGDADAAANDALPAAFGASCDLVLTSRLCKVHVELDRIMAARDVGYWAQLMCLISPLAAAPNKLDLLVGAPADHAATGHLQHMLSS